MASQNAMTDGCIEETRATEGSADASSRYRPHSQRVEPSTLSQSPPASTGATAASRPASAEQIEVGAIEVPPRLPFRSSGTPLGADLMDCSGNFSSGGRHWPRLLGRLGSPKRCAGGLATPDVHRAAGSESLLADG